MGSKALALSLMLAAPVGATAQQPPAAAPALVFDGVTVIDVERGNLLQAQRVVIVGSRIQVVGAAGEVKIPNGAQVVDARGKYLIPGLWDLHAHLNNKSAIGPDYSLFIANGITGIREPGTTIPLDSLVRWRREVRAGTRVGPPRQFFSGKWINGPKWCLPDRPCLRDPANARRLVDSLKAAGADMIKMYNLSPPIYFALAAAARRAGLMFGGHLWQTLPIAASDSGASIVDHAVKTSDGELAVLCFHPRQATVESCGPVAEHFRRNNTVSVPTTLVLVGPGERTINDLLSKTVERFWADSTFDPGWLRNYTLQPFSDTLDLPTLQIAMQVGLPTAVGTDGGGSGLGCHAELVSLVERGLTPLAALQAGTLNPARALRVADSLGTVAPGKLADLVLLDANPLTNITNTTAIRAVVANGRYFDRAALDRLLTDVGIKVVQRP